MTLDASEADFADPARGAAAIEEPCHGLPRGSVVLWIGAVDSGKSTQLRTIANEAFAAGRSIAVLDLDVGQGELGAPCAVHAAFAERSEPVRSIRELPTIASVFVGGITPVHRLLDLCLGAVRLLAEARSQDPGIILIDTCGLVTGAAGRVLKQRLIEALAPDRVIALQKERELEPILGGLRGLRKPDVVRCAVSAEAGRKSGAVRSARRAARFLAALENARPIEWDFDDVALLGQSFTLGEDLPLGARTLIERSLGASVMSATALDGQAFVVARQNRWDESDIAGAASALHLKRIHITAASNYHHLVVGLIDSSGFLRDIGVIDRIDFDRRRITILTRCPPGVVAQVRFGHYRVRPDGREIGEVRIADL